MLGAKFAPVHFVKTLCTFDAFGASFALNTVLVQVLNQNRRKTGAKLALLDQFLSPLEIKPLCGLPLFWGQIPLMLIT
ncbi:hypothetical protein [Pseudolactococcus hodotermopsidis]|uniref:hypothetical protein n=1 Tax=Pseudolactococcus hodotermopsidis TaxID=2709157 RepID=UPI001553C64D|nr:hypothetical protein [Lactococcus hodotermopsidis]